VGAESGGSGVMSAAHDMVMGAADLVAAKGPGAAYLQLFDAAPNEPDAQAEIANERLGRDAARGLLRKRVESGFVGLLGFSCFEESDPQRVYVEVFDTREPQQRQGTAISLALSLPMKRTWTGKYRPAARQGVFHGEADSLGVGDV
jgi:hypothetical protein